MNDTRYALMQHDPSGEVYAVRYLDNGHGTITGLCGPLAQDERDSRGDEYHYDDGDEDDRLLDLEWANAIGTDADQNESLLFIRDLP